jgi:sensor histidine kinase YesM
MVENAIKHGIAPKIEPSRLRIIARPGQRCLWIAVIDDGLGMTSAARRRVLSFKDEHVEHGLQLLTMQLELLYGRRSRIRLFSTIDDGTLVAFAIPDSQGRPDMLEGGI